MEQQTNKLKKKNLTYKCVLTEKSTESLKSTTHPLRRSAQALKLSLPAVFPQNTILRQRRNLAPVCSNPGPNIYNFIYSVETELLFHFRGCLVNQLILGMRTIENLEFLNTNTVPSRLSGFSAPSRCFWFSIRFLPFDGLSSD